MRSQARSILRLVVVAAAFFAITSLIWRPDPTVSVDTIRALTSLQWAEDDNYHKLRELIVRWKAIGPEPEDWRKSHWRAIYAAQKMFEMATYIRSFYNFKRDKRERYLYYRLSEGTRLPDQPVEFMLVCYHHWQSPPYDVYIPCPSRLDVEQMPAESGRPPPERLDASWPKIVGDGKSEQYRFQTNPVDLVAGTAGVTRNGIFFVSLDAIRRSRLTREMWFVSPLIQKNFERKELLEGNFWAPISDRFPVDARLMALIEGNQGYAIQLDVDYENLPP